MRRAWATTLFAVAFLVIGGALIGWIYEQALLGAFIGTAVSLGWQLYQLFRLHRWVETGELDLMPDGSGVWPQLFARINFVRNKASRRAKRWRSLVKELRATARAFPDGGIILNERNEIVILNNAAKALLGLKKKRDRGQRIDNLVRDPGFVEYLESPSDSEAVQFSSPINADIWLTARLIPYGPGQKLMLVRDITDTVRTEKMRRDFVANASHELRTPLTVIAGYLDALQEDQDLPVHWEKPLVDMGDQAQRMTLLIGDLLQLSRMESSESRAGRQPVDMAGILAAARKEAMADEEAPSTIELDVQCDSPVLGEESEIQSVVNNLVSNAIRYTPRDGTVSISWRRDDRGGHLAVIDTGIGITADDIPRVTERFYRTDEGRQLRQMGTGLGLAIVKHALKRHDAELEIHSGPGEGSEFVCHFPTHRLAAA